MKLKWGVLVNMIILEKSYEEISAEINTVVNELRVLKQDATVKQYLKKVKDLKELKKERESIYKIMKTEEYSECNHILVYTSITEDPRGRIQRTCGCIKCGLDESVLLNKNDKVDFKEKIMKDYLLRHGACLNGLKLLKVCDLSLGTAIYNRIKEVHPDIDDNTAFSHFKYAINHIKYVPVSESRKVSRAKRLSLQEDFNNWVSTHDSWKNRKND